MTSILNEENKRVIRDALARGTGGHYTEAELQAVLKFVAKAAMQFAAVRLILEGDLDVRFENGGIAFELNERGRVWEIKH